MLAGSHTPTPKHRLLQAKGLATVGPRGRVAGLRSRSKPPWTRAAPHQPQPQLGVRALPSHFNTESDPFRHQVTPAQPTPGGCSSYEVCGCGENPLESSAEEWEPKARAASYLLCLQTPSGGDDSAYSSTTLKTAHAPACGGDSAVACQVAPCCDTPSFQVLEQALSQVKDGAAMAKTVGRREAEM